MKDFLLSYDTISLRPRFSSLESRGNADTSLIFLGKKLKLPVIPANMQDVVDRNICKYLSQNEYFYIYHRFDKEDTTHCFVDNANNEKWDLISVSVGIKKDDMNVLSDIKSDGLKIDFLTIDVAHGHHKDVSLMVDFIKTNFSNTKLIVGNVATADGVEYLCRLGVDAVKVGIGGGSICTTRYMTGFYLPTLESIWEANEVMNLYGWEIPIIADGGAKHYGDIAKALTFGATMVMSGGWFASCIDSPAKIVDGKKLYRGSTSFEMKGKHKHIEGRTLELEEGFTYEERMVEIKDAITSQISYAGGVDLSAFDHVAWERILPFH
jgi:GMP reductase